MSPAATKISRPRNRPRTGSTPRCPTHEKFARLKALKASSIRRPAARPADRRALLALPREAGRSRAAAPDHRQGQRHREDVQCLSRERQRPQITDSEVRRVLKESRDSAERKAVWEGSKGVGPLVEADLKALVKLRNEAARKLGFTNYHALQLHLAEQSQEQMLKLFDELDESDARAVPQAQGRDRRQARRPDAASRSTSCVPGTITTRSSRNRRRSSRPTSTRSMPRPTSSSFAASSMPASACRSTT